LFRLLKAGFQIPSTEKYPLDVDRLDRLENYVLEYGIRHKNQWTQEEPWKYQRFRGFDEAKQTDQEMQLQEEMNSCKEQITAMFLSFTKAIESAETVLDRVTIIYRLLEKMQIPEQLEKKMQQFETDGEIEKSREEEQVWNGVLELMD